MTDIMVDGSQEVAIYVIGWPYKGKKPEYPKQKGPKSLKEETF